MILTPDFDHCTLRSKITLSCDYCGKEFLRVKKSIQKLNTIIQKDSCGEKDCTRKKKEEINLLKYGHSNLFESDFFKQKQQQTNLENFGTSEYFNSEDFQQKRKASLLSKYGAESPLQNDEIKQKQQDTCLKKYGVSNYSSTDECQAKKIATSLENYGCEHPTQNPEVIQAREATSTEKFGVPNYSQTSEYWDRRKKTCLERYGVEHPHQSKEVMDKVIKTNLERYSVVNYAQTAEFRERFIKTCLERYGVENPLCLQVNQVYGKTQNEIKDFLNSFGFSFESTYSVLGDQEIDLYDESVKIGIEYCGLYWHTDLSPSPRLRYYHHRKYMKCLQNGVRLITIFEDEWKGRREQCEGILMSILGKTEKIYARSCIVKEVDRVTFNKFCNLYHLQGSNNLGLVFYVLEFGGEVVAGMSLGRHHRKQELTLDRLFFKSSVQVIGGASKLFKRCVEWAVGHDYHKIISWSDNRWSQGNIYKKLGFDLDGLLPPDYSYVDIKKPYSRISKQSRKKSNTGCPIDVTEQAWALENGLARIWDCGKKRWAYELNTI